MRFEIQTRPLGYLSRATIGVAKRLCEELEDAQLVDLDTEFYDELKKAYSDFNEEFSKKSYQQSKIQELYLSLREATICALKHYVGDSKMSRQYYKASLRFTDIETKYIRIIKNCTSIVENSQSFVDCTTQFRKIEEDLLNAVTPSDDEFDKANESLDICICANNIK